MKGRRRLTTSSLHRSNFFAASDPARRGQHYPSDNEARRGGTTLPAGHVLGGMDFATTAHGPWLESSNPVSAKRVGIGLECLIKFRIVVHLDW